MKKQESKKLQELVINELSKKQLATIRGGAVVQDDIVFVNGIIQDDVIFVNGIVHDEILF